MNTTTNNLPIKRGLRLTYAASLLIAALLVIASTAGLLYPATIYPTGELLDSFLVNDLVNLLIGLPILLLSMWLTRRGQLVGLLFWPGALFFVLYNYLIYLFGMPLNNFFLLYLCLVTLSLYTLIGLVAGIDGAEVQQLLTAAVPERLSGSILAGLGTLFFLRVFVVTINALIDQQPLARTEIALLVTDFLTSPAWIISGALLWRRQALGYVSGLGLLFQASMLFIGLIVVLLLKPIMIPGPSALSDVLVVFIMGLICFIPFFLYLRGVLSKQGTTSS